MEDQVNDWILENHPVRALSTTLDEARSLGAMALFGEKYGEIVRMVEVGDGGLSRELCGGTHVRSTAEIGLLTIVSETSSAANVRRIEALSGPAAVGLMRERDRQLAEIATLLRTTPQEAAGAVRAREEQRRKLESEARRGGAGAGIDAAALAASARQIDDVPLVAAIVELTDAKALPDAADRVKGQLPTDGIVILAAAIDGRAHILRASPPRSSAAASEPASWSKPPPRSSAAAAAAATRSPRPAAASPRSSTKPSKQRPKPSRKP